MIYACRKCRYVFESKKEPLTCPDCGDSQICEANDTEKAEYERNKEEFSVVVKDNDTGTNKLI